MAASWKFPGQGLNPSHGCSNTRFFKPRHWARDRTPTSKVAKAFASDSEPTEPQQVLLDLESGGKDCHMAEETEETNPS